MTVALSFPVENFPENMVFLAITNRLRGVAGEGEGVAKKDQRPLL